MQPATSPTQGRGASPLFSRRSLVIAVAASVAIVLVVVVSYAAVKVAHRKPATGPESTAGQFVAKIAGDTRLVAAETAIVLEDVRRVTRSASTERVHDLVHDARHLQGTAAALRDKAAQALPVDSDDELQFVVAISNVSAVAHMLIQATDPDSSLTLAVAGRNLRLARATWDITAAALWQDAGEFVVPTIA